MQYLLIISHDDAFRPTDSLVEEIVGWVNEMERQGIRRHGNPLRPPADAMTVRVRDGQLAVTTGPFTDSAEQMCAYELLECASLQEAVSIASRHPMAKAATIEVRPVWTELTGPAG